jgi:hypothetical protein
MQKALLRLSLIVNKMFSSRQLLCSVSVFGGNYYSDVVMDDHQLLREYAQTRKPSISQGS